MLYCYDMVVCLCFYFNREKEHSNPGFSRIMITALEIELEQLISTLTEMQYVYVVI